MGSPRNFSNEWFLHKCVAARIMEELSSQSCAQGYHVYQDVWDTSYWRMDVRNTCSVNISWDLISYTCATTEFLVTTIFLITVYLLMYEKNNLLSNTGQMHAHFPDSLTHIANSTAIYHHTCSTIKKHITNCYHFNTVILQISHHFNTIPKGNEINLQIYSIWTELPHNCFRRCVFLQGV